ncbi:MAG: 5'-nucleotidase C-terminal domain-containing protein [Clostridia bacterium]|nr:5'-nucleotidase C-terminal domain-containing protein [Clostridia bacterium]HRS21594.1 5'-nucleotidase C-terminal domain-containing protein [Clostridia bacterium]
MKQASKRLSWILTVVMLMTMLIPMSSVHAEDNNAVTVTLLGTSDLHANIATFDYYTQKEAQQGIAKVYSVVKDVRGKNPNTILIDNGDTIQGTPFAQYYLDNFNSETEAKIKHPMMKIMNMMKYDAWTLGNHEFNYGLELLEKVMGDADFPVLSANIYKADGTNYVKPYIIKEINGIKIGILGFTTTGVTTWDKNNVKDLQFKDIVEEGKKWVKVLKETEKVDAIVVSAHSGIEKKDDVLNEDQVKALAVACPEITAILSGHAHADIGGQTENGVLIVQPKKWGQRVAEIDLTFEKTDGKWAVTKKESKNIDVKDYEPAKEVLDLVKTDIDAVDALVNTIIGKSTAEFSGIGQQIKDTALVDLIQEVQMYYGNADVSIAASFNDSSRIPEGDVKVSDINALYVYENWLNVTEMTGKQLRDYIEFSANYFNLIKPGDELITFDPNVPGYNYDMVQGVNYQLDLTQPAGQRVVNLTFKGEHVTDTQTFRVALNNYRYSGGGGHMAAIGLTQPKNLYDSAVTLGDDGQIRTLIINYIKEKGTISPVVDNNYNLITVPTDRYTAAAGDTLESVAKKYGKTVEELLSVNNMAAKDANTALLAGRIIFIPKEKTVKKINILTSNDFHGLLAGGGSDPGIAKLVGNLKAHEALNKEGTLILSAGDMFQGSADSNLMYGKPVVAAMNAAGFDAMVLGNHEFDWGIDKLKERMDQSDFPYLAANLVEKSTGKAPDFVEPYIIVNKKGVNVGIIGIVTPETASKTKPELIEPYDFKNPAEVVNALVPEVKKAGADIVVVLSHLGAFQDSKTGEITGEAADLAKAVTGVDAIISGHTHTTVSGTVNNIPIVQAYKNGRAVGHLEIYFDIKDKKVVEAVPSVDGSVAKASPDANIAAYFKYIQSLIGPIKNEIIGKAAADFPHSPKDTQTTLLGNWVTDVMRKAVNADIAIQNGGGLRRDLPAGNITMGLMYEIMPFDNTLFTVDLTGAQVRAAIEHGIMSEAMNPGQFSGLKVQYDSTMPAGQRIVKITLSDGKPLVDTQIYKVVTNDFQATGGDNYTMFLEGKNSKDTSIPVRDILVNEIKEKGTISPVDDGRLMDISKTSMIIYRLAA